MTPSEQLGSPIRNITTDSSLPDAGNDFLFKEGLDLWDKHFKPAEGADKVIQLLIALVGLNHFCPLNSGTTSLRDLLTKSSFLLYCLTPVSLVILLLVSYLMWSRRSPQLTRLRQSTLMLKRIMELAQLARLLCMLERRGKTRLLSVKLRLMLRTALMRCSSGLRRRKKPRERRRSLQSFGLKSLVALLLLL
ncbi:uncharacterized protein LOC125506775 [Triticum urartu]|uniref:uncharacterized protein LOC125506775 n=1 Tax=Triticum urartu TaxID=4572 RepID=UPI002043332F|nr:uncharacterized protein LOC125506775 [Triticum urartu]